MTATTYTLYSTGRRSAGAWKHLLATPLASLTAAWADLTGFHIVDSLPQAPPRTTHLWAWTTGHWLRLRIDYPYWWAALLTNTPTELRAPWNTTPVAVTVDIRTVLPWGDDNRIAQRRVTPPDALTQPMIEFVPLRPTTASFLGAEATRP